MSPFDEGIAGEQSRATCLFLDIGGVLLSDGWARESRAHAAAIFDLDIAELDERHHEVFATYELDQLSLDEYLDLVVFYEPRSFNHDQFWAFMCSQSEPFPNMIALIEELKAKYKLKIVAVSNEARDLNNFRIHKYRLATFVDSFVSSCFVHKRKPDKDIFKLALDIAHVQPGEVVFIDNTALFVEIARELFIPSIHHTDFESTRSKLAAYGLSSEDGTEQHGNPNT